MQELGSSEQSQHKVWLPFETTVGFTTNFIGFSDWV
jgi:hypothetical protein